MNMNHGPTESKCCDHAPEPSALDQYFDKLDLANNCQLQLCMAARLILDNFQKLDTMRNDPEVTALYGVIGGIEASAKQASDAIEFAYTDALTTVFGVRA